MRPFQLFSIVAVGLSLQACSGHFYQPSLDVATSPAAYSAPAVENVKRKIGNPYVIDGVRYYPQAESNGYVEKGIASWYGKEFHRKKTANGEIYNMYAMTAAHKTLPLPTYVRVTNLKNNKSVVVRVNDRGPFVKSRLIDMSYAGAVALGFSEQGTAPVLVEALPTDGSTLARKSYKPVNLSSIKKPFKPEYKGSPIQPKKKPALKNGGFTHRVTSSAHQSANTPSAKEITAIEKTSSTAGVTYYVQLGAFTNKENAQKIANKTTAEHRTAIFDAIINGQTFYRVRLGPVDTVDQADRLLTYATRKGFKKAIIVVD